MWTPPLPEAEAMGGAATARANIAAMTAMLFDRRVPIR
jgi:hypothetical protein